MLLNKDWAFHPRPLTFQVNSWLPNQPSLVDLHFIYRFCYSFSFKNSKNRMKWVWMNLCVNQVQFILRYSIYSIMKIKHSLIFPNYVNKKSIAPSPHITQSKSHQKYKKKLYIKFQIATKCPWESHDFTNWYEMFYLVILCKL